MTEFPSREEAAPVVTPVDLGYRWPAEWEPHAATWCSWPHNRASWPGKFEPVPFQFANFVQQLAAFEPVQVLAGGVDVRAVAESFLGTVPGVRLVDIPTNDAWCRDHGPTFLAGRSKAPPALIDWEYNAWGGKYPPFELDNDVPRRIASLESRIRFAPGLVLEGGSIDGNGDGTILTTRQCLLNPNRNPGRSREEIERFLETYLGCRKVIWLSGGELAGDDTDGHVDQLARFVNEATVVVATESDRQDENYEPLATNWNELRAACDADGRVLSLVPLPLPRPKFFAGQRMPASYLNFYIANGAVFVPQYDDPADEVALRTLDELFPGHRVLGLPALDLVWGLGTFHCLTQQEPLPYHGV